MPTYEYQCEKCGLIFEEFQSISEKPLTHCRKDGCDGTVKRLISPEPVFCLRVPDFTSPIIVRIHINRRRNQKARLRHLHRLHRVHPDRLPLLQQNNPTRQTVRLHSPEDFCMFIDETTIE